MVNNLTEAQINAIVAKVVSEIKSPASAPVSAKPNFSIFKRLAPNITGIARKKLNSEAAYLEQPKRIPPKIVAPEREVPGIRDNT